MVALKKILILLLLIILSEFSQAQMAFDNSFGTNGLTTITGFPLYTSLCSDHYSYSDGKILMTGSVLSDYNTASDVGVSRLNPDGSLDNTFGQGGLVTIKTSDRSDAAMSIAVDGNGKIILGGASRDDSNVSDALFIRLNADGTLDNSFGNGGISILKLSLQADFINDILIDGGNQIIATGSIYNGSGHDLIAVRLNTNGTLDNTFGVAGIFTASNNGIGKRILMDSNEKLLIVGESYFSVNSQNIIVKRIKSDGSIDNTYGVSGGRVISGSYFQARDAIIDLSNNLYITGSKYNNFDGHDQLQLVKIDNDGLNVNTFGSSGIINIVVTSSNCSSVGSSIILTNGSVYTTVSVIDNTLNQFRLVIIKIDPATGNIDNGFGTIGEKLLLSSYDYPSASAMSVNSTGDIIISGQVIIEGSTYMNTLKINNAGDLITTFGNNGVISNGWGDTYEYPMALIQDSNNKILIAGTTKSTYYSFGISRLNTNGTLDATFGIKGKAAINFGNDTNSEAIDIAIDNTNKIIIAGFTEKNSYKKIAVSRLNSNGTLDASFGSIGKQLIDLGGSNSYINTVLVDANNKIILAGVSNSNMMIMRLNTDGSTDDSFGINGIVTIPSAGVGAYDMSFDLNNKIVVVGPAYSTKDKLFVVRLNEDGSLDNSFNTTGILVTTLSSSTGEASVLIDQGKILVTARNNPDLIVIRLNNDGSFDNTFGINGQQLLITSDGTESVPKILKYDMGYLVTAFSSIAAPTCNLVVTKINDYGAIDVGFGNNGQIVSTGSSFNTYYMGAQVSYDGKLLIATKYLYNTSYLSESDFAVYKIELPTVINSNIKTNEFGTISIYPNPVKETLTLDANIVLENISIYSSLGKKVPISFITDNIINTNSLEKGIYFLQIRSKNEEFSLKFLKE